jgi:hypothetical protein
LKEVFWASHFMPADARPMAPAIVEVVGTVYGTTRMLERVEDCEPEYAVGVSKSNVGEPLVATRFTLTLLSFE